MNEFSLPRIEHSLQRSTSMHENLSHACTSLPCVLHPPRIEKYNTCMHPHFVVGSTPSKNRRCMHPLCIGICAISPAANKSAHGSKAGMDLLITPLVKENNLEQQVKLTKKLVIGDKSTLPILDCGDFVIKTAKFGDVLHVPRFGPNLLSIYRITHTNKRLEFWPDKWVMKDMSNFFKVVAARYFDESDQMYNKDIIIYF
jgi:hypothetical protein